MGHSTALLVATRGRSCNASVIAFVAHDTRVRALRADGVQEGEKYTLLHELVDLGNSLVQCRRVRGNIGLRQGQQVVTDFSRKIDL